MGARRAQQIIPGHVDSSLRMHDPPLLLLPSSPSILSASIVLLAVASLYRTISPGPSRKVAFAFESVAGAMFETQSRVYLFGR
jgi:hypothetical protein